MRGRWGGGWGGATPHPGGGMRARIRRRTAGRTRQDPAHPINHHDRLTNTPKPAGYRQQLEEATGEVRMDGIRRITGTTAQKAP